MDGYYNSMIIMFFVLYIVDTKSAVPRFVISGSGVRFLSPAPNKTGT